MTVAARGLAVMVLGASLTACGSGSDRGPAAASPTVPSVTATSPATGTTPPVSVSAAPPVPPFPDATTDPAPGPGDSGSTPNSRRGLLVVYEESGGITGRSTRIQITRDGRVTTTSLVTGPSPVGRQLSRGDLARLTTLVNSTALTGTCSHEVYPDAISVSLAAGGQKISCVEGFPATVRPLQTEVRRLAG